MAEQSLTTKVGQIVFAIIAHGILKVHRLTLAHNTDMQGLYTLLFKIHTSY